MKSSTLTSLILSVAFSILAVFVVGCVQHDYLGEHLAPTQTVSVIYDNTTIPDGYRKMGQDHAQATDSMSAEDIVKDIVNKAKEVGADAVIIQGMKTVVTGTSTNTTGDASGSQSFHDGHHGEHTDTDLQYSQNTSTTVEKDKIITATFLKKL